MSVKVYIHFEEDGYPNKTSKIQLPKSWSSKLVSDVINLFVKQYNKQNPDNELDEAVLHFELKEGNKLYSNATVESTLEDHVDYYVRFGVHVQEAVQTKVLEEGMFKCKNYGCNQIYREEENSDDACQHHTGPPIFHDTMKCWSCCRDKKSYDFESFQEIKGCNFGRHSNVAKQMTISPSPNNTSSSEGQQETVFKAPLKSISSYNKENPDAKSAVDQAKEQNVRKSSRNADGTTAKCQRKGCQMQFEIVSNSETSCTYHKGQPVFHDAIKMWSCCPDKKCFDFDEFLAVPGCAVGFHDDGVIDI